MAPLCRFCHQKAGSGPALTVVPYRGQLGNLRHIRLIYGLLIISLPTRRGPFDQNSLPKHKTGRSQLRVAASL
eukprot:1544919-Prorocentrum_lima.AAC.1